MGSSYKFKHYCSYIFVFSALSNFSTAATTCSRFNWPIQVSWGFSASEKNGLKYLLQIFPYMLLMTVWIIIFSKGFHKEPTLCWMRSLSDEPRSHLSNFSSFSSFNADGANRMQGQSWLIVFKLGTSISSAKMSSSLSPSQYLTIMKLINFTISSRISLGPRAGSSFTKARIFQFDRRAVYPQASRCCSRLSKQYSVLSLSQIVNPPSLWPTLFSFLVQTKTQKTQMRKQV